MHCNILCTAVALLIQPSHSALTGETCNQWILATRLRKYSHETFDETNNIFASVSVSLSNPCLTIPQRIVRAAEKIVGVSLPSLQDIYSTRLTRKALSIAGDPTHPTHNFFSLLPSGRRLRSLQARTSRLKDSFIHQAVRKLNSLPSLPPLPSFNPMQHWTLTLRPPPPPPPPAPHTPRTSPPLQTVTRTSHFVQHWTDLYLIQHCL